MNVIKRNGSEVAFDIYKIFLAIKKASDEVSKENINLKMSEDDIYNISNKLYNKYEKIKRSIHVEEIQDDVELELMKSKNFDIAKAYIKYRYEHELIRKSNTTDASILTLINGDNEEIKQENSNKNPTIISVQRDYMAGEVSKDITERFLLPEDIVKAHKDGIIHFHDEDYFAQYGMYNCSLVNLEDMLQNGTVISETMIEKPHRFTTACNIATQIIAQVASNQYGLN